MIAWSLPPKGLALPDGDVHLWRAFLGCSDPTQERLWRTLSPLERLRARQFELEPQRRRYVTGRGLLRFVLSRYLSVAPGRVPIQTAPGGKPVLPEPAPLHFNLSHSAGLMIIAVSRQPVGVDLERIRPIADLLSVAEPFFSASERAWLSQLPEAERTRAFFAGWTRKEAFLKATGEGFARPAAGVEVTLAPEGPAQLLRVDGDADAAARWFLSSFTPAPHFAAAVAATTPEAVISLWDIPAGL